MIARIPLLTGLLIVQLVLLAVLLLGGDEDRGAAKLLDVEQARVNALSFEDGDGKSISLKKIDGGWQIGELPADAEKIDEVIAALLGGSANWPVATSESSQARFEVAEDAFQRRVQFAGEGGELATLYLGSSPGFRRIHAREADADAIFSIDFAVHQLPVDGSDWLDKQLLQAESISRVTFPDGAVLAGDDESGWTLDGQAADQEAASRFVERIEGLSVLGLHEASPDTVLGEPVTIAVQDGQGSHELSFSFNEAADEYVLTSDRQPGEFTAASYIVEQILVPAAELLPEEGLQSSEENEEALTPVPAAGEG